ncbi:hypothetical protein [uncultured Lamprocystis sp.]|jgi:hypothetical protein|uniref:hypothetical protein n=1 Tax=uncultured Lamprocystis sp. TaxID=543132 RepID=UPI0025FA375A|nr:hypothetical protein [uncultured Lamprocystis sp.]
MAAPLTPVRLPALAGGTASVRLVYQDSPQTQVLGFDGPEWVTAYARIDLAAAQTIDLTPTAAIATPDGRATAYLITVQAPGGRGAPYLVQVPESAAVLELVDLVGAAVIDPAGIGAGRLLTLAERAALSRANTPSDSNPIATIADVGSNVWYISDDEASVTMGVGTAALVGETDTPYPIVTIQIEYET